MLECLRNFASFLIPNGDRPKGKNPQTPIEDQIANLLGSMTLPEKIGPMTQVDVAVRYFSGDGGRTWAFTGKLP